MTRKNIKLDPRIGNGRVGGMVTRGQIKHRGHAALEAQMLMDNSRNIVCFGSSQRHGEFNNPLTADQKVRAHQGVWGDAFSIVQLQDIGATDRSTDWADYVFRRIASHALPELTDFYAGSIHEARWYEAHFVNLDGPPSYRMGLFDVWENPVTNKRIHILDRDRHIPISASQVRTLLERRDPAWRQMVPAKLWDFYEWEYPPELRDAVAMDPEGWHFPLEASYPVGTKLVGRQGEILILRDDGKWRARSAAEAGKSMGD